ncbi:MAG: hypothetical protein Q9168_008031, partial [Polycauliona sp. 1 TL-2023]
MKKTKMYRQISNHAILTQVNALSNRSDAIWWESIIQHRLQAKAKSEGEKVNRRFQNANHIDHETAKRMAELINGEEMDLITFELTARGPDEKGKRPTLKAIRKHRQECQALAREDLRIKLAHGDNVPSSLAVPTELVEPPEIPHGGRQGQSIHMQSETTSTLDTPELLLGNSPEMERPVKLTDDAHTDTTTPTPINTPRTADPTHITPSLSNVAGQVIEAGSLPHPSETLPRLVIPEKQPFPLAPPVPDRNSQPIEDSAPGHSDQASSVQDRPHSGVSQPQPSTPVSQTGEITTPGSSSATTPTQASFDRSFAPTSVQPTMNHTGLWQNIKWAYRTHTRADLDLQSKGIWLFEKPLGCLPKLNSNDISSLQLQADCPVAIFPDFDDRSEPYLEYNNNALMMYTHLPPWTNDTRSIENFAGIVPDFLSEVPLAEYQGVEALGSYVWRHDRDMLPCRGPNCDKMLSDMALATLICLGCGPKSMVRFCSIDCHLASLPKHVSECWNPRLLINKLIDENSAPPRFSHLAPSLRDRHGHRTYQNYRQRVAAQYAGGRYSMFNPATEEATILIWDRKFARHRHPELPYPGYATEMETRVERCLNIALFDRTNTPVVEHLYRLLQLCLQVKGAWNPSLAAVLTRQFALEFEFDAT